MSEKKILVLCTSDPNGDPRPNRMITWLKDQNDLTVVGGVNTEAEGVRSFALFPSREKDYVRHSTAEGIIIAIKERTVIEKSIKAIKKRFYFSSFHYFILVLLKQYEELLRRQHTGSESIRKELSREDFDIIISHDITLMPLVFAIKGDKNTKVMLDAREFYLKNFNDNLRWRIMTKPINNFLCKKYLHRCDKIITVSDGLAEEYAQVYDIEKPQVFMSLPYPQILKPVKNEDNDLKIIHHGYANTSRKTETMIEMMDFVDERFTLDLMLLETRGKYWKKINAMAENRANVQIIPPVNFHEIVPFTNAYDIGVFLVPPSNFNLKYTLPNKFFEFIQARLAVAIGPSIEMMKLVEEYDCGIVAKDFEPRSLAEELNKLTPEKLIYYKEQSHKAAQELNTDTNKELIDKIIEETLLATE